MEKERFSIVNLANNDGFFDLQFRKDTRHERTNSPTYYRWKTQFIITTPKENTNVLEKVKKGMRCGNITVAKEQARFCVQKMDDLVEIIIPYFTKNRLANNKKKDFDLWQKAVEIIYRNKGKYIARWKKNDMLHLIEIHKSSTKYKNKPKKPKWIQMAQAMSKTL